MCVYSSLTDSSSRYEAGTGSSPIVVGNGFVPGEMDTEPFFESNSTSEGVTINSSNLRCLFGRIMRKHNTRKQINPIKSNTVSIGYFLNSRVSLVHFRATLIGVNPKTHQSQSTNSVELK